MQELIYKINDKSYLLIGLTMTVKNKDQVNELLKKYNCILQDVKPEKINYGFDIVNLSSSWETIVNIKALVPEENVLPFNEERLNLK